MPPFLIAALFAFASIAHAQDYVGTYEAVAPKGLIDSAYAKAWEMSKLRIEILPERIVFAVGSLLPKPTNITYTREGSFLLAKQQTEQGLMFYPIYIADKDTIFAQGDKLLRVPGHIEVQNE